MVHSRVVGVRGRPYHWSPRLARTMTAPDATDINLIMFATLLLVVCMMVALA